MEEIHTQFAKSAEVAIECRGKQATALILPHKKGGLKGSMKVMLYVAD